MITPISRIDKTSNIAFKAGIVNLSSDFDGTYMPEEFNHDVICRDKYTLDKDKFQKHFNDFEQTANTIRGKGVEPKFHFTVTTGRNVHEFNYFMQKIKQKGLSILLPDNLVTNNGRDDFFKTNGDFFHSDKAVPFEFQDKNQAKITHIKKVANGWDGETIKEKIKEFFNQSTIKEVQTTNLFYAPGMSLQDELNANPSNNFVAIRKDGNLNIHLAFPAHKTREISTIKDALETKLKENGTKMIVDAHFNDPNAIGANGENLPSIDIVPQMENGKKLTKEYDLKAQINHINDNNTNDLVIVAGDAQNDFKMLNLFNYTGEAESLSNPHTLKKMYDLPVIAIYVNNGKSQDESIFKTLNIPSDKVDDYFNSDGKVRFICVDKTNPQKPQSLQEAIVVATKEYAKRNPKFRENLSPEMKAKIDNLNYSYPISKNVISKIEEKTRTQLSETKQTTSKTKMRQSISAKGKFAVFGAAIGALAVVDYTLYHSRSQKKQKPQSLSNKASATKK